MAEGRDTDKKGRKEIVDHLKKEIVDHLKKERAGPLRKEKVDLLGPIVKQE